MVIQFQSIQYCRTQKQGKWSNEKWKIPFHLDGVNYRLVENDFNGEVITIFFLFFATSLAIRYYGKGCR